MKVLSFVAAALIAGGTALYLLLTSEWFLKRELVAFVAGDTLTLEVGHAHVRAGTLYATDLVAHWGGEGDQRRVRVTIAGAKIDPAWGQLLLGRVRFERLVIEQPQVTFIDDAAGRPTPPSTGSFAWPRVEAESFDLRDGTFTLVRVNKGTRAVLIVRTIAAHVEAFGTTAARRDRPVRADVTAQLGFSGRAKLAITARPTAAEPSAEIELRMTDQDLKEFGDFFEPNVGLSIRGRLIDGRARSVMRGPRVTTTLTARFDHLALKVRPTAERGSFAAIATNFGLAFGVKSGNAAEARGQRTFTAETRRTADDSIFTLVLRGLRDAALAVAERPLARKLTH